MKSDAWPFVPPTHRKKLGESPFRIRGSAYAGYVHRVQREVPGGLSTVLAKLDNNDVAAFIRDTIFLAASTYDIEPLMHVERVLAQITGIPLDKLVREGSRRAAEADIVGTYKAQMRSASTEEMATRLPRIFERYFDPCRAENLHIQPTSVDMRFSGLPASALGFYIWPNEGFITGALEAVGARDVRFNWATPAADSELDGVPTQSITCRATWKNS